MLLKLVNDIAENKFTTLLQNDIGLLQQMQSSVTSVCIIN